MPAGWSAGSQQPQVAKDQASMAGSLRADLNCSCPFVPTLSAMFRVAGPLGVLTPSLSPPIAGVEKDSSPQLPWGWPHPLLRSWEVLPHKGVGHLSSANNHPPESCPEGKICLKQTLSQLANLFPFCRFPRAPRAQCSYLDIRPACTWRCYSTTCRETGLTPGQMEGRLVGQDSCGLVRTHRTTPQLGGSPRRGHLGGGQQPHT